MDHVDDIEGCCTLTFVKEFLEEEPVSKGQDFDHDNFLPLFLFPCSDIAATEKLFAKWNTLKLQFAVFQNSLNYFGHSAQTFKKLVMFLFSIKAYFFRHGRPQFLVVV